MSGVRKTVCVITDDIMLFQKIKLELFGVCNTVMASKPISDAHTHLIDADNEAYAGLSGIKMKRGEGGEISLPFIKGSLRARFEDTPEQSISVSADGTVVVGNTAARLTEVEMALFLSLYNRGGGYATRKELLDEVWGEGADGGVLNVYVHYLRGKLEKNGERIIISSRGKGYKINDIYFGGKNAENN